MVDRIKQVMEHYEETPAGFAEKIGVNRSNLTHLFSGRNQPSLDFAKKVLTAFPEVSTEWLIMGVGNMIKSPEEMNMQPRKEYVQTDLFGSIDEEETSEPEAVVETSMEPVTIGNENDIQEPNEESSLENVKTDESIVTPSEGVEVVETEVIKPAEQPLATSPESNIPKPVVHPSGKSNSRTVERISAKPSQSHSNTQSVDMPMASSAEKPQTRPVARPVEKTVVTPVERPKTVSMERPVAVHTEQAPAPREKKIEKIIFFYDDDSFKVYHP